MNRPDTESAVRVRLAASVGRRVVAARKRLGLSQDELASASGASKGTIVQIEQGRANPSIASLCRLAVALGLSVEDLISEPVGTSVQVILAPEPRMLWNGPEGGSAHLLIGTRGANMLELWQWRLADGERFDSPGHTIGTREIIAVEEGALAIEVGGTSHIVRAGAAASFEADRPHAYIGRGSSVTLFKMVVEEPERGSRR
ncbi:MAG: helix-turn-helix domain-containing protein [Hyphomicrobiaceae bacterium]